MVVLEVKMYLHVGVSVTVLSKRHFERKKGCLRDKHMHKCESVCYRDDFTFYFPLYPTRV